MDIYEKSALEARHREMAGVGAKYAAPLRDYNWYRWKGGNPAGRWMPGAGTRHADQPGLQVNAVQVYDGGLWHPVTMFTDGYFGPAANYTVGGIPMADADGNPRDLAELAAPAEPEKPNAQALSESSGHLLRAARAMALESVDMAKEIKEELDAEDSDAEYMALDLQTKLEWIANVLEIAEENEGLGA